MFKKKKFEKKKEKKKKEKKKYWYRMQLTQTHLPVLIIQKCIRKLSVKMFIKTKPEQKRPICTEWF